jgi:hypothetical protein
VVSRAVAVSSDIAPSRNTTDRGDVFVIAPTRLSNVST